MTTAGDPLLPATPLVDYTDEHGGPQEVWGTRRRNVRKAYDEAADTGSLEVATAHDLADDIGLHPYDLWPRGQWDEAATAAGRHHPLARCESCALYDEGTYVPESPGTSDVVLLGNGAGLVDARHGVPYAGQTGKVLAYAAREAGNPPRLLDATVTHYVGCATSSKRAVKQSEANACSGRLDALLEDAGTVIALGSQPGKAAMGRKVKVTEDRFGRAERSERGDYDVAVTYNPGGLRYSPRRQRDLVRDLRKAVQPDDSMWTEPDTEVIRDSGRAQEVLHELAASDEPLIVDLETAEAPDAIWAKAERITALGIGTDPEHPYVFTEQSLESAFAVQALRYCLRSSFVVCHNGKFDLQVLDHHGHAGRAVKLGGDTMLAAYALDERRGGKSLGALAQEFVGAPAWKEEMDWSKPDENLFTYNGRDVAATILLWRFMERRMAEAGVRELHDELCATSDLLRRVESRGLPLDLDALHEDRERVSVELDELEAGLKETWELDNPRSHPQVKAALHANGADVDSTAKEVLKRLAEQPDDAGRFAAAMLEFRDLSRFQRHFLGKLDSREYCHNGVVYPGYNQHVTETGRLSASSPNIQQQPKRAKHYFVPRPGRVFAEADLKSAELRVIAAESGDEGLAEVFRNDEDLHTEVSRAIERDRRTAKTVVYGLAYGRTAYGLSRGLGISVDEGQEILERLFARFPKVRDWQDSILAKVRRGATLETRFGRRYRLPAPGSAVIGRRERSDLERAALAFVPQSTASDICLRAAVALDADGWEIVALVHDSITIETEPERGEEAVRAIDAAVLQAGRAYTDLLPFPTEGGVGRRWSEV